MTGSSASNHGLRRVLIFGGAGFIGSNWAEHLLRSTNATVRLFDNLSRPGSECNLRWLKTNFAGSGRLKITIADIRDFAAVRSAVAGANEIYHLAAQVAVTTSVSSPREDFEVNAGGTLNILEAARENGHRPFLLFTSTNKVYGSLSSEHVVAETTRYRFRDPGGISEEQALDFLSPYGCSKGAADQYVRDYARIFDIPSVVVRMSCIAGPRQFGTEDQGWLAHFIYSALQDMPITIYGDGRQMRDVLHVRDLMHAFELLWANSAVTAGNIYNVGGGEANTVSLLELIGEIKKLLGKRLACDFSAARIGDQLAYVTAFEKLARHTGWEPTLNLRTILRDIVAWYREHQDSVTQVRTPLLASPLAEEKAVRVS